MHNFDSKHLMPNSKVHTAVSVVCQLIMSVQYQHLFLIVDFSALIILCSLSSISPLVLSYSSSMLSYSRYYLPPLHPSVVISRNIPRIWKWRRIALSVRKVLPNDIRFPRFRPL